MDPQHQFMALSVKRQKPASTAAHFSISAAKERKDKLGAKIVALQQLVSPYGKTDTASVLLEAMEYIQFLHDQVKVLSAPYLQTTLMPQGQEQEQEHEPAPDCYSLRGRGLCVVPVSSTLAVARSNGADIWAPIKSTSPKPILN